MTVGVQQELLERFLRREIGLDGLLADVDALLERQPEAAAALTDLLVVHLRSGRLTAAEYSAIEGQLATAAARTRLSTGPVTRSRASQANASTDTRLRPPSTSPRTMRSTTTTAAGDGASLWENLADLPPVPYQALVPGALIKQRFLLEERVGEGGMGVVFKAIDQRMQEAEDRNPHLAIKFLSEGFRQHPAALKALQREVRKAHALAHPNIVTVYDFDRDGPLIYMTMEFIEGVTLDKHIKGLAGLGLQFDAAWPIIDGCGRALAYAHENGIVHSDFKPGNVMLASDGRVKVLDFGIARAARDEESNDATRFDVSSLGALTPAYASPEMLLNLDPDPRDDVYALACVAYSLLAGKHPFDGMPAYRAQHEQLSVPPIKGLSRRRMRALRRGLAFTRKARTPSVKQFLSELRRARDERRTMRVVAASATGALLLVGLAGYSYWAQRCARLDDAFIAKLIADARSAEVEIDPEYKDVLLEQGFEYLDMAERQFDAAILSEGVSSAFGAFRSVLQIDPQAPEPIEGIRRIIRLYELEAERLYKAGRFAESVEVADYGLALHPRDCTLQRLRQRAAPTVDGATAFEVRLKSRLQAC